MIKLLHFSVDEDDFCNISIRLISNCAEVECDMYISRADLIDLKENIELMYDFKLKEFTFNYEASGLSDNVKMDFLLKKNGHVIIDYTIHSHDGSLFKSYIDSDVETIHSFGRDIGA